MSSLLSPAQPSERSPLLQPSSDSVVNVRGDDGNRKHPSDGEDGETPSEETLPTGKILIIMLTIWFGTFLSALDSTIVATLSAPIASSFNSFTVLSWLASGYLIAQAASQPLSGKLTDIFGRRAGLIFSNVFFLLGNLICGLANSTWVMIFGRVVAGIGGGGLNSISTIVASDLIPLRQRGIWQGMGNICWGVGSGLGGVYGGWINDLIGWRWAFLIQVPFIALSAILIICIVDIPVKQQGISRLKRVDFAGAFLLVASLVLLLLGLNTGGNLLPWSHPLVIASIVASAISLLLFIYVEDRLATEPMIPVRLLLNRTVAAACLTNWFESMAQYGLLFYGPIYFQLSGMTATQAGARLIPQSIGIGLGATIAGYIMRMTGKYYTINVIMESTRLLSCLLFATTLTPSLAPVWPFIYFFLFGIGFSSMLTITLLALIAAVSHENQAVITSASYAARSTGSSLGITIASAVFQNILIRDLWARFGDRPGAKDVIGRVRDDIDEIGRLPAGWREGVMDAYGRALQGVWWSVVGLAALGMLSSLWMREHKLHTNLARK